MQRNAADGASVSSCFSSRDQHPLRIVKQQEVEIVPLRVERQQAFHCAPP